MKTLKTDNYDLVYLVADKMWIVTDGNCDIVLSEEQARHLPALVEEFMPEAINDYTLE